MDGEREKDSNVSIINYVATLDRRNYPFSPTITLVSALIIMLHP